MSWNGSDKATSSPAGKSLAGGGSVRPSRAQRAPRANTAIRRGLLAGLLVVALGCGALYFFTRPAPQPPDLSTPKHPNPSKIAAATPSVPTNRPAAEKASYKAPVKREVVKTGDKMKDALAEVEAQGELVKITGIKVSNVQPPVKKVFSTCVEQVMSHLTMTELGDLPMPIPHLDEDDRKELVEALVSKNEVKEGDSEVVAYAKESVDQLKKEMTAFIKDGGDPDDFLQYYHDQLRQASDTHDEVADQYHDLQISDPDIAEEFLKKANKVLEQKGIKLVPSDEEADIAAAETAKDAPASAN